MVEVIFRKSTVKGKKYDVIFPDKKVSFGGSDYQDYTIHKDDKGVTHTLNGTALHNRGQI